MMITIIVIIIIIITHGAGSYGERLDKTRSV